MAESERVIAIGIDLAWPLKHHFEVAQGVFDHARERGWRYELAPYMETASRPIQIPPHIDGIVARAGSPLVVAANVQGVPAVNVWKGAPDQSLPAVFVDFAFAGQAAARHFSSHGIRNFGFAGAADDSACVELEHGFSSGIGGLAASYKTVELSENFAELDEWEDVQNRIKAWIDDLNTPAGLFVESEMLGRFVMEYITSRGLNVPHEISILSYGNNEHFCEQVRPTLSSIEAGCWQQGRRAALLLEQLMNGEPAPDEPLYVLPGEVVHRGSSSGLTVDDEIVSRALSIIWGPIHVACVEDVAKQLPATRRTIERRFREKLGRTIYSEIQRVRVERAKRLLRVSSISVRTVAERAGFGSTEHMSHVFRKLEGHAPTWFRSLGGRITGEIEPDGGNY
jgi:LacI family transcriptional regulator